MSNKLFRLLVLVCIGLSLVYWFSQDRPQDKAGLGVSLIPEKFANKIAQFKVTTPKGQLEIVAKDGRWVLPQISNYPADAARVNSFLLRFVGTKLSQSVSSKEERYKDFNLVPEASNTEEHAGLITFIGTKGDKLADVFVGKRRESKGQSPDPRMPMLAMAGGGQYVRSSLDPRVFISDEVFPLSVETSSWVDQTIVNRARARLLKVEQLNLGSDPLGTPVFTFERESQLDGDNFKFIGDVPEGKELDDSAKTLAISGLENLRLEDVISSDADEIAEIQFDRLTRYYYDDGLVYSVRSAEADDAKKAYVRLDVTFDQSLISSQDKRTTDQADTSESTKKDAEEVTLPKVASASEATELKQKLNPWVYLLAEFQAKKFRQSKDTLFKESE